MGGGKNETWHKEVYPKAFKLLFGRKGVGRDGESLKYSRNKIRVIEVFGSSE